MYSPDRLNVEGPLSISTGSRGPLDPRGRVWNEATGLWSAQAQTLDSLSAVGEFVVTASRLRETK